MWPTALPIYRRHCLHLFGRYVPTSSNPADCASRGLFPTQLQEHPLWWHGPSWLIESSYLWRAQASGNVEFDTVAAEAQICANLAVDKDIHPLLGLLRRFSSWPKVISITIHLLRFIQHNYYARILSCAWINWV